MGLTACSTIQARLGARPSRPSVSPRLGPPHRKWGEGGYGASLIVTLHALMLATALLFALCLSATAQTFPELTGRVVDQAGILRPEDRLALDQKLKAHEEKTSDQVVVATVRSLEGVPIEDYANRLYRAWKLGTKDKNNGALLLVAPSDRKVRIEVGYGVEGALTDALTGIIIRTAIAPRFKVGDFAGGINAGIDGMLAVLTGDAEEWQRKGRTPRADSVSAVDWITILWVLVVIFIIARAFMQESRGVSRSHRRRGGGWIVLPGPSGSGWGGGGGWSGGGGGGGFSGGGGSSGGGGASGSW